MCLRGIIARIVVRDIVCNMGVIGIYFHCICGIGAFITAILLRVWHVILCEQGRHCVYVAISFAIFVAVV